MKFYVVGSYIEAVQVASAMGHVAVSKPKSSYSTEEILDFFPKKDPIDLISEEAMGKIDREIFHSGRGFHPVFTVEVNNAIPKRDEDKLESKDMKWPVTHSASRQDIKLVSVEFINHDRKDKQHLSSFSLEGRELSEPKSLLSCICGR